MRESDIEAYKQFFDAHIQDANAAQFLMDVLTLCRTWDDGHDGDKVDPGRVDRSYMNLMHWIPNNPFYQAYAQQLHTMMIMMYIKWQVANEYERKNEGIEKAYMLRAGMYDIIHYVLFLTCGLEEAEKLGMKLWNMYCDTVDDLKAEVA